MDYKLKIDNRNLNSEELNKLCNFFIEILSHSSNNLIYRRDSIKNLKSKLNIQDFDDFDEKLKNFIFNIGEKGRYYQNEYREKQIKKKKNIFPIDSTDRIFFEYIFDKFNKIFKPSIKNREIIEFGEKNSIFKDYFLNKKTNKNVFVDSILSESISKNDKIRIRDYYLAILHRVGKIGFYHNSFFVSTSTDKKIVEETFSDSISGSITFVGWYVSEITDKIKTILDNNGLPIAEKELYGFQKEISVKGGILPHFLLGYIKEETKEFFINPNFFEPNTPIEMLVNFGIPLNQDNFSKTLNETNYTGYFTVDNQNNYNENNRNK